MFSYKFNIFASMEEHEFSREDIQRIRRHKKMEEIYEYRMWLKRHTVQKYTDTYDEDNYDLSDEFNW